MIASITGQVEHVGLTTAVVSVGGFGVQVHATAETLSGLRTGAEVRLDTAYVARKDEAPLLFGFRGAAEREVFEIMLGVSGVGPRTALAVLSVLGPDDVHRAIAQGDAKAFTRVPGIGPKGARRIVLELADKLIVPERPAAPAAAPVEPWRAQLLEALVGLGWNEKDAARGIADALADRDDLVASGDVPVLLRTVLAWLGAAKAGTRSAAERGA
ncbi:Holliday junction ATP-dependent DNA helicase RuvA [Kocuria dechangensis]|uniref:Holliday junction branch migration complex subunit RuvA n=1 Tax=Kocuria dechangensis TaxID=1176249 RepID=A0A917GX81_9MICC|nr:Holliday junction branch migration protein RuvA [Kocuria dechangensis]GGG59630.1 Holliday junction ATP-dependent DNA helicase RuvA [Kocuria dechangensis]